MTNEAEPILRQPDPTENDEQLLDSIVKHHLGEQATGQFVGAMARGVKGDNPHYGHAVVITDPGISDYREDSTTYYERVANAAIEIGNRVTVAGNVTLDITNHLLT